jgi:hypothetical protein
VYIQKYTAYATIRNLFNFVFLENLFIYIGFLLIYYFFYYYGFMGFYGLFTVGYWLGWGRRGKLFCISATWGITEKFNEGIAKGNGIYIGIIIGLLNRF